MNKRQLFGEWSTYWGFRRNFWLLYADVKCRLPGPRCGPAGANPNGALLVPLDESLEKLDRSLEAEREQGKSPHC